MNRKLKILATGIIICLVGIVYFQVDWLFTTYKVGLQGLTERNKDAVVSALKKHQQRVEKEQDSLIYDNFKYRPLTVKRSINRNELSVVFDEMNKIVYLIS